MRLVPRVLHLLSQRPSLTGSGVTLDALVRRAASAGWQQRAVVGVPAADPHPSVGDLAPDRVHPLVFESGELPFPVPGMSDVMPYQSTRFSSLTEPQVAAYLEAWRRHLEPLIADFGPQVIHAHHLWLLSAVLKDLAPAVPVVGHCHGTGFRQMALCPHLAPQVRAGCARLDGFAVLHREHAAQVVETLGVDAARVHVVGAGYRDDLFHARGRRQDTGRRLLYIGKYSAAKGLPQLLEAFGRLHGAIPKLELHVAGSGSGDEAEALRERMLGLAPAVVLHGQLDQTRLADLMRRSAVCVLPSFYEGLPLVLVEALACGCRLVTTRLPGVDSRLEPHLGPALELVALPSMTAIDTPDPAGLPAFVDRLEAAIQRAFDLGPIDDPERALPGALDPFTWSAVFHRVEALWQELVES
jgi:glycosyltransferase involved in cell wall biosynthesis